MSRSHRIALDVLTAVAIGVLFALALVAWWAGDIA